MFSFGVCACPRSWKTTLDPTALSGMRRVFLGVAGGRLKAAACYTPTTRTQPALATTCPAMPSS